MIGNRRSHFPVLKLEYAQSFHSHRNRLSKLSATEVDLAQFGQLDAFYDKDDKKTEGDTLHFDPK